MELQNFFMNRRANTSEEKYTCTTIWKIVRVIGLFMNVSKIRTWGLIRYVNGSFFICENMVNF